MKRVCLVMAQISLLSLFLSGCDTDNKSESLIEGATPTVSGLTMTYGLYPQANVNDPKLVSALNELDSPEINSWYLYEGNYYAKTVALARKDPRNPDFVPKFDNGDIIYEGTTYWFKCEPITWKTLKHLNDVYTVVSNMLLDTHPYSSTGSNNYAESEIRSWLNGDFHSTAFALDDSHIRTTLVDNSPSTTEDENNPNACPNTEDKVFLLSSRDYYNENYGFYDLLERQCKTTDWVRARGAFVDSGWPNYKDLDNGAYWTRSPDSESNNMVQVVSGGGQVSLYSGGVTNTTVCVRPAISVFYKR